MAPANFTAVVGTPTSTLAFPITSTIDAISADGRPMLLHIVAGKKHHFPFGDFSIEHKTVESTASASTTSWVSKQTFLPNDPRLPGSSWIDDDGNVLTIVKSKKSKKSVPTNSSTASDDDACPEKPFAVHRLTVFSRSAIKRAANISHTDNNNTDAQSDVAYLSIIPKGSVRVTDTVEEKTNSVHDTTHQSSASGTGYRIKFKGTGAKYLDKLLDKALEHIHSHEGDEDAIDAIITEFAVDMYRVNGTELPYEVVEEEEE